MRNRELPGDWSQSQDRIFLLHHWQVPLRIPLLRFWLILVDSGKMWRSSCAVATIVSSIGHRSREPGQGASSREMRLTVRGGMRRPAINTPMGSGAWLVKECGTTLQMGGKLRCFERIRHHWRFLLRGLPTLDTNEESRTKQFTLNESACATSYGLKVYIRCGRHH